MKKTNRRSKIQYASLKPEYNLKTRRDLIDYDYLDKLSPKEKEWLAKFTEEYTNASFKKGKKHLHKNKDGKKDCYDRNNARNRDIYTREKAQGSLEYFPDLPEISEENVYKDVEKDEKED